MTKLNNALILHVANKYLKYIIWNLLLLFFLILSNCIYKKHLKFLGIKKERISGIKSAILSDLEISDFFRIVQNYEKLLKFNFFNIHY